MTTPQKIHGVDISHHQSQNIGWAALKRAGVQWLYHKATEGVGFTDPNYTRRRAEAKAAGMPFGAYHFAQPGKDDAKAEAAFFIKVAKPVPGDLRPVLDLETTNGLSPSSLAAWADTFCFEVERLCGVFPMVYTPFTLSASLERKALFWVPRYNNDNRPPAREWDIWQFSNGQLGVPNQVPGLGGVDLNTSKVHLADLLIPKVTVVKTSRGVNVDSAIASLDKASGTGERRKLIDRARLILRKIKPTR